MSAIGSAGKKASLSDESQPLLYEDHSKNQPHDNPGTNDKSKDEWNAWVSAAKRSRTARQLRADINNNVVKVSFFSGRSVKEVEAKMARNPNDAAENRSSLTRIEHSLKLRFGRVVGNAVFNQIFKNKVAAGRPISSLEVRLADNLGKSLETEVHRLLTTNPANKVEVGINQAFAVAMKDDFSDLSGDDWDKLTIEFISRLLTIEQGVYMSESSNIQSESKENDPLLMTEIVKREISETGGFDTSKYENLSNEKIKEYTEILNLHNKIRKTSSILQESLCNPECDFGLLFENRECDFKMLKTLQKVEQKLARMLAEAESKVIFFGELIAIAKNIGNNTDEKGDKDSLSEIGSSQGATMEKLIGADDAVGIASSPILTDADRNAIEALLAGESISKSFVDEDDKSVAFSITSLDSLSGDDLSLSPEEMTASQAFLRSKNKIAPTNRVVEKKENIGLEFDSSKENRRSIAVMLAQLGLKTNPTKGDGNCLFHAINRQLENPYDDVQKMRSHLADLAQDEANRTSDDRLPDIQAPLLAWEIKDLRARPTDDVPKDKNPLDLWGDILLHGPYIARLTNRPVVCFTPEEGVVIYEKGKPREVLPSIEDLPKNAILLAFNGRNHYEAVSKMDDKSLSPPNDEVDAPEGAMPPRASALRTLPQVDLVNCPVKNIMPITAATIGGLESWLANSGANPYSLGVKQLIEIVNVCGPQGDAPLSPSAYTKAKDFLMMVYDKKTVDLGNLINKANKEIEDVGNKIESARGGIFSLHLRSAFGNVKAKDLLKNFASLPEELKMLIKEFEEHSLLANKLPKLSKLESSVQMYLAKALYEIRTQSKDPLKLAYMANNPPELLTPVINELQARLNSEKDEKTGCFSDQAAKSLLEALKVVRLSEGVANRHILQKPVDLDGALNSAKTAVRKYSDTLRQYSSEIQVYDEELERYRNAGRIKKFYIRTFIDDPTTQDRIAARSELSAQLEEGNKHLADLKVLEENALEYVELMKICNDRYPECVERIQTAQKNIKLLTAYSSPA